ncbi:hypothetical protein A6K26_000090 [Gammaproteobacteria bacterium 2W06]|nr:hypothetical protein A6K26_000090 [Gammaproteobacteria bacterium 2W06]
MMTSTIDLARLLLDGYKDKAGREAVTERIRQSIHRELRLNAELATEAANVHAREPDLARALLTEMPLDMFNAVSASGLPLTNIFPSAWNVAADPPSTYSERLKNIEKVSELVERAYHRIRIQQIRNQVGQIKDPRSLGYLRVLLGQAAKATKPSA